jgi:hypothetical protein
VCWFAVCQALTPRHVYGEAVTGRLAVIDIPAAGPPGPFRRPI